MFDLVEKNSNNCKYLNKNIVQIKSLKTELIRDPFELHYKYEAINKNAPLKATSGEKTIIIKDFENKWLNRNYEDIHISRKSVNSIFLHIKSNVESNAHGSVTFQYKINDGEWETCPFKLDFTYCLIDNTNQFLAVLYPNEAIYNCRMIKDDDSKKDCFLISLKNIEDNNIVNFDIMTDTPLHKDFRIQVLNDQNKLVRVSKITFLIKILVNNEFL